MQSNQIAFIEDRNSCRRVRFEDAVPLRTGGAGGARVDVAGVPSVRHCAGTLLQSLSAVTALCYPEREREREREREKESQREPERERELKPSKRREPLTEAIGSFEGGLLPQALRPVGRSLHSSIASRVLWEGDGDHRCREGGGGGGGGAGAGLERSAIGCCPLCACGGCGAPNRHLQPQTTA